MIHDNSKKIDFFHGIFWRFRKRPYLCTVFKRERQHNQIKKGRLAQLVQSVCLTSRGSGVRIPQRPPLKQEKAKLLSPVFVYLPSNETASQAHPQVISASSQAEERSALSQRKTTEFIYDIPCLMQLRGF